MIIIVLIMSCDLKTSHYEIANDGLIQYCGVQKSELNVIKANAWTKLLSLKHP